MDSVKIGQLIRHLRQERQQTQKQLADQLHISHKTVSKWERGLGCPDLSLLTELSGLLHVELETLLRGEWEEKEGENGNMKALHFYVCPSCGGLVTAAADTAVACCGKRLQALEAERAEGADRLTAELVENDYFITSRHPMTKEHHISFVALLTGDTLVLRRQYPEWDLQTRIPALGHGQLLWHCTRHGLFVQNL